MFFSTALCVIGVFSQIPRVLVGQEPNVMTLGEVSSSNNEGELAHVRQKLEKARESLEKQTQEVEDLRRQYSVALAKNVELPRIRKRATLAEEQLREAQAKLLHLEDDLSIAQRKQENTNTTIKNLEKNLETSTNKNAETLTYTGELQKRIKALQSEREKLERSCDGPQDVEVFIEDNTVYRVIDGNKKEIFQLNEERWQYDSKAFLNPSLSLVAFLARSKSSLKRTLMIADLQSGSEEIIEFERFFSVRNLKWAGERVMRVYLEVNGSGDVNEYRITNNGIYELVLDKYASLTSTPSHKF